MDWQVAGGIVERNQPSRRATLEMRLLCTSLRTVHEGLFKERAGNLWIGAAGIGMHMDDSNSCTLAGTLRPCIAR